MRKIILASRSQARKRLLKQVGLTCEVSPSDYREKKHSGTKGAKCLVIANASAKALSVALRYKRGVIVACDTVICVHGRIIGKPKDLRHAEKMIALLIGEPHWVYTGLAVFDVDRHKLYTDWEKTKIYMAHLNKDQIRSYCRKYRPLDKAGGFDIQGPGALLVSRVEGCFYNVVGLPLRKFEVILKKVGVDVFNRERT